MQRFENIFQTKQIYQDASDRQLMLVDIETTGLSYERSMIYMISCGFYDNDQVKVISLFNDDGISEENLLLAFIDILESCKQDSVQPICLVSFNGLTFDIPFLQRHFHYHEMDYDLYQYDMLDLFRELKTCKCAFGLKKCRQTDFEELMGISRDHDQCGKELIKAYRQFLSSKDEGIREELLRHNVYDVYHMSLLLPLLYLKNLPEQLDVILDTSVGSDIFTVNMTMKHGIDSCITMTSDCHEGAYFTLQDNLLTLCLPIREGKIRIYYENYRDYYYLPSEDRAIHKSVGSYVAKEHRMKAKKETCYDRIAPERITGLCQDAMLPLLLSQMKCIFPL